MGKFAGDGLSLQMIDNRGVKVWPAGRAETFCTDSFRCRYIADGSSGAPDIGAVLRRVAASGIDIAAVFTLRDFDGKSGFSLAQGQ
jgi:isocitrate dehydrogenase